MSIKVDALITIVNDQIRNRKGTPTLYKRTLKHLRNLGFDGDDLNAALYRLGFADTDGNPYRWTGAHRVTATEEALERARG